MAALIVKSAPCKLCSLYFKEHYGHSRNISQVVHTRPKKSCNQINKTSYRSKATKPDPNKAKLHKASTQHLAQNRNPHKARADLRILMMPRTLIILEILRKFFACIRICCTPLFMIDNLRLKAIISINISD